MEPNNKKVLEVAKTRIIVERKTSETRLMTMRSIQDKHTEEVVDNRAGEDTEEVGVKDLMETIVDLDSIFHMIIEVEITTCKIREINQEMTT